VILLDANILLYACNADAPQHSRVAAWLEEALAGAEPVGLPLPTVWAFLRISTNPRIWPKPKPAAEAFQIVRDLLQSAGVVLVQPGPGHLKILEQLSGKYNIAGPSFTDGALAAMAIENGAVLASTDRGFARFENLRSVNPLA
jgi:toxin-antitoxin system PIN domain toxin